MEFNCNFDSANFCQYSSHGWGFQKSLNLVTNQILNQQLSRSRNNVAENDVKLIHKNFFPCADTTTSSNVPILKKIISDNVTEPICLSLSYLVESGGFLSIQSGQETWIDRVDSKQWKKISMYVAGNNKKTTATTTDSPEKVSQYFLEIQGRSACVDNLTATFNGPLCARRNTGFGLGEAGNGHFTPGIQNGSGVFTHWLLQPMTMLVLIVVLFSLLLLSGLFASVFCISSKRSSNGSRKHPYHHQQHHKQRYRYSVDQSCQPGGGDDDNLDTTMVTVHEDTGSGLITPHHHYCHHHYAHYGNNKCKLPAIVHVRNNPNNCFIAGRNTALDNASVISNNHPSSPQCRFSLALTEDAQLQLLSNDSLAVAKQQSSQQVINSNLEPTSAAAATANATESNVATTSVAERPDIGLVECANTTTNTTVVESSSTTSNSSYSSQSPRLQSTSSSVQNSSTNQQQQQQLHLQLHQQDIISISASASTASPTTNRDDQPRRPNSILLLPPNFCTPVIDQNEESEGNTNDNSVHNNSSSNNTGSSVSNGGFGTYGTVDAGAVIRRDELTLSRLSAAESMSIGGGAGGNNSSSMRDRSDSSPVMIMVSDDAAASCSSVCPGAAATRAGGVHNNRTRPIKESLNIGYVSDSSLCDLPHYDEALQLLAAAKDGITITTGSTIASSGIGVGVGGATVDAENSFQETSTSNQNPFLYNDNAQYDSKINYDFENNNYVK